FQIKSDLCVDAVICDFAVVYFSGEFLDVNRANVPKCLRGFLYSALRGILPALRRLRHQFDNFNDFSDGDLILLHLFYRRRRASCAFFWSPIRVAGPWCLGKFIWGCGDATTSAILLNTATEAST